jgi:uncharacterized protein (DUF1800 family)
MATTTRRRFLALSGLTAVSLAACRRVPNPEWLVGRARVGRRAHEPVGLRELDAARLLSRAGYGARDGDVERAAAIGADAWVEEQLSPDSIPDAKAFFLVRRIESVSLRAPDVFDLARATVVTDLRRATILRAVYSERQLLERMVEFWSDHFNVFAGKAECAWLKIVDDREVIRRHALGRFRDLLAASATSPAMLVYLDGRANVAGKPNENYAREILELHTLGVDGGYTQADVMELARALTGWQVRTVFERGRTVLREKAHDGLVKSVLGLTLDSGARRDLERIVNRLAAHPSTARFLAHKLCRRFVADEPPATVVERVANAYTASGGDIRQTLSALFHSREIRSAPPKFQRPYGYAVSALRRTGAATDGGPALQRRLDEMGQLPFAWPTPDGYPDVEEAWSPRMLPRWNFALALANNAIRGTRVQTDLAPEELAFDLARPEAQYC